MAEFTPGANTLAGGAYSSGPYATGQQETFAISDGTNSTNATFTYNPVGMSYIYGGNILYGSGAENDAVMDFFSFYNGNAAAPGAALATPVVEMEFDDPLTNLSFQINDIDLTGGKSDRVIVEAFDDLGNPVPITLVSSDGTIHQINSNGASGVLDVEGIASTGGMAVGMDAIELLIAGPVSTVNVYHTNGSVGTSEAIGFNDFDFASVACFGGGTLIATAQGPVPVETLSPGDLVLTCDHGCQPLIWVGVSRVRARGKAAPVRIPAGLLGNTRDLYLSRQHRVLIRSKIVERMFGVPEVLIPAIRLTALPGVALERDGAPMTYVNLLFERHHVVVAEGAAAESLLAGPFALRTLPDVDARQIRRLLPGPLTQRVGMSAARIIPDADRQKQLIARHLRNDQPLVEGGVAPDAFRMKSDPVLYESVGAPAKYCARFAPS